MDVGEAAEQIRKVQGCLERATNKVREIMQRQQRRLEHNRRFLDGLGN
jgi:hypothetical protein